MFKSVLIALVLAGSTSVGALAQTTNENPLASFDVSQFEAQPLSVAVATDKQSGRKFNVVKMPNGKTMILMSPYKINALSPYADDSEMMYSGHTGTSR